MAQNYNIKNTNIKSVSTISILWPCRVIGVISQSIIHLLISRFEPKCHSIKNYINFIHQLRNGVWVIVNEKKLAIRHMKKKAYIHIFFLMNESIHTYVHIYITFIEGEILRKKKYDNTCRGYNEVENEKSWGPHVINLPCHACMTHDWPMTCRDWQIGMHYISML